MNAEVELAEFDSSEVSDALDSLHIESVLLGMKPLALGMKIIGPAYTVQYKPYSEQPLDFKSAGDYIDNIPAGSVVFIDNQGRADCTTWGDILTEVALHKGLLGTVIHGACRDVNSIRTLGYPVFSSAITMRSGKNRVYKASEQAVLKVGEVSIHPGDYIFADDCGVLVIPKDKLQTVIARAKNIRQTEQQIIHAIHAGMSLAKARSIHRYDKPWLSSSEKCT